jgi:dipeptidase E
MKLFLSSVALTPQLLESFVKLVGKPASAISIALIENAADVYEGEPAWVKQNREAILAARFKEVTPVDLRTYDDASALMATLRNHDVIWLGGGNSYYLRWLLKVSSADRIIKNLVGEGAVYAGGSAGAIMAGPTLEYFETADDPSQAPETIIDGLRLTQTVIVPHFDNAKFAPVIKGINQKLTAAGFETCPLNDDQALIIDGDHQMIVP